MSFEVSCPTCRKKVKWTEQEQWRPFCSERCRLIDLGEWASEERRIIGNATNIDEDKDSPNYPSVNN